MSSDKKAAGVIEQAVQAYHPTAAVLFEAAMSLAAPFLEFAGCADDERAA